MKTTLFPTPQRVERAEGGIVLGDAARVCVQPGATGETRRTAELLSRELSERLFRVIRVAGEPASGAPCVEVQTDTGHEAWPEEVKPEGYSLTVGPDGVRIVGKDERGTFYGVQTLLQFLDIELVDDERLPPVRKTGDVELPGVRILDWPRFPIRAVHAFLPAPDQFAFFKGFVKFLARAKFNMLMIEVGSGMRFDSRPELNLGYKEFAKAVRHSGLPKGPGKRYQDSTHHSVAGGDCLEKNDVRDLTAFARSHHLDVVPEIQSLSHVYHLVAAHKELAELPEAEWPDAYCPSNPESYRLLFDVMDEFIDVMEPKWVHIGHDEWRTAGLCPQCSQRDAADLFAEDVNRIYKRLKEKGVEVMMWADHLKKVHTGIGTRRYNEKNDTFVDTPTTWQAGVRMPKDILMINWGWKGGPENEAELIAHGFKTIYGNFSSAIGPDFDKRMNAPGVLGAEASTWTATDEASFANRITGFAHLLDVSAALWPEKTQNRRDRTLGVYAWLPRVRDGLVPANVLKRWEMKSDFFPIGVGAAANAPDRDADYGWDLGSMPAREFAADGTRWVIGEGEPRFVVCGRPHIDAPYARRVRIEVGRKLDALMLLHTLSGPRGKKATGWQERGFPGSLPSRTLQGSGKKGNVRADPLAWYEVAYEDGFVAMEPIRYQMNILEWDALELPSGQATPYYALPVLFHAAGRGASSGEGNVPVCAFSWEIRNSRPDVAIREVSLIGAPGENGALPILLAATAVQFREVVLSR